MGGKDLSNLKFGRWTAISRVNELYDGTHTYWKCICDCGNTGIVRTDQLTGGISKSCGCLVADTSRKTCIERNFVHGLRHHPLYNTWYKLSGRCYVVSNNCYEDYGARGITVCDEWRHDFKAFHDWAIANGWKEGLTIDRIDNDGPYAPWNCRWASLIVQANNKRNNIRLEYMGEVHTMAEWCRILDLKHSRVQSRIQNGWSVEDAFTKPKVKGRSKNDR